MRYSLDRDSRKNAAKPDDYPRRLDRLERLGMLLGPAAYVASAHGMRARPDRRTAAARPAAGEVA